MVKISVGVSADNRVSVAHIHQLFEQFLAAQQRREPICFVPRNPGRFFCSGFALAELIGQPEQHVANAFETFLLLARAVFHSPCRVGVSAQGHAVGVGAMLALAADRCVMSRQAKLRFPEVLLGLGLFPDMVDLIRYRTAPAKAELLLCDAVGLDAERACGLGLISGYQNEGDETDEVMSGLCTTGGAEATAHMKKLCRQGFLQSPVAPQIDGFMQLWSSADTQQRLREFVDPASSRPGQSG